MTARRAAPTAPGVALRIRQACKHRIGVMFLVLALACAACSTAVVPTPERGVITITNEDDEPAMVEWTLADSEAAHEEVIGSIELAPGEAGDIDMDPSWAPEDFAVRVNGILAVQGGEFNGCGPEAGFIERHLEIIVRPNGGPDICP